MFSIPPASGATPPAFGGTSRGGEATSTTGNNANGGSPMVLTGESSTQVIDSMHSDYIFKVAFDTYGRRMATCSADRFVRLWDLQDTGEWALVGQWQAHRGAVTSLAFAHPEFGHLLATCGSDHDAIIWEERTSHGAGPTNSLSSRWTACASLTDARRAVTCLEFAPRHWGLKLAVGSADGSVRIYEAVDIMNLAQWPLAATLPSQNHISSLSWCTGRFEPLTLVAGGSHLVIYRYIESARAWKSLMELPTSSDVLDVAWAPNVGRRFHYIAATSDDGQLRVYKLSRKIPTGSSTAGATPANPRKTGKDQGKASQQQQHALELESFQTLNANAWGCQWNVTGTVLASSGDGGIVQLWKADVASGGEFQCVSQVQGGTMADPNFMET